MEHYEEDSHAGIVGYWMVLPCGRFPMVFLLFSGEAAGLSGVFLV
jgi:hypothetical protein